MNIRTLKFATLLAMAAFALSACTKDDGEDTRIPETSPFVMTYDDFISPNDVQIVSSDTTCITVSKAYADKMGIRDFKNRAVTIWRSIGTIPFVRIIKDVQTSKDVITLTTVKGELSDMFTDLDIMLESDLYVNRNFQPTKGTRAGTDAEADDISGKYMDEEGILHPAVIIFDEEAPAVKSMMARTGSSKNYFTAEELLEDNLTFNLLSLNSNFEVDLHYPNDSTSNVGVHLKGKVGVQAQLSAFLNLNIGIGKVKKFEAGFKGDASLAAKLALAVNYKLEKDWDQTLFNFGETTMVFWVGWVPVPYTIKTKLMQRTGAEASASAEILASLKYGVGFESGCRYTSSNGWSTIGEGGKSSKDFKFDGVKGTAAAEFSAGVFFESGVYLLGCAGPKISLGPKFTAEAEVSAAVSEEKISVDASCAAYAGLGANIGAELTIFGYTLAKWSTGIDLFKVTIFEGAFSAEYTPSGWDKVVAEWNAALYSENWDIIESAKTPIPYRLPSREMNFN